MSVPEKEVIVLDVYLAGLGVMHDYTRALDYFQQAHAAGDAQASVEATGYIDVMNVATGFFGPVDQIRLTAEGRKFIPMMLRKFGDSAEALRPATFTNVWAELRSQPAGRT